MTRRSASLGAAALVLALAPGPARSEESLFSLQFLGIREETSDARARALGSLGIALGDERTAATLNPGSLAKLQYMTLSLVGGVSWRTSSDASREDSESESSFPHLRAALPLPGRFVISGGLVGLRNYRGDFVLARQSVGDFTYVQQFHREGSLYAAPLGLARSFGSRVHVGVTMDLLFGTVDESWTAAGDSLVALRTRRRDGFDGTTVTLGAVVEPWRWLHVGVAWSPNTTLDQETRLTVEDIRLPGTTPLREDRFLAEATYPGVLRAGLSLHSSKLVVVGDYLHRDFTDWTGRLYEAEAVDTERRLGGGVELRPHRGPRGSQIVYRLGLSHSTWPQLLGGERLEETVVHFGSGFDLHDRLGRCDVAVEYARTGSLDRNGYEESRWGIVVSLTGQEMWRRKRGGK